MEFQWLLVALVGLLPVCVFLAGLVFFDSYKLVKLKTVLLTLLLGALASGLSYLVNSGLLKSFDLEWLTLTRYVAPVVEECLKALCVILLIHLHRIGFLVDAAILGFAVGAGFALVENFYYFQQLDAKFGIWFVRGFGTAIMHGGVTAIFAILLQTLSDRSLKVALKYYLIALLPAVLIHGFYNQFILNPMTSTMMIIALLPAFLYLVFIRSQAHVSEWLELDFDADAQLIADLSNGRFSETKAGQYMQSLRDRFEGEVLLDMFCYLKLYTELAIRAKGILMMKENGFDIPAGERTDAKFKELQYLEKSLGKSGLLVVRPFLQMDRKDLWQLNMLSEHTKV